MSSLRFRGPYNSFVASVIHSPRSLRVLSAKAIISGLAHSVILKYGYKYIGYSLLQKRHVNVSHVGS
jgi:hypothetical protein